jgi:endoglucanase
MLLLVCVLMLVSAPTAHAQDLDGPNPLEGITLYNDPAAPAMSSWRHLQRRGRTRQADLIWKIAREPRAVWVGRFTRPRFHFKVRRIIDSAKAQGTVPVIAVLRAESTQCSPSYTAGGPAADRRVPGTEISRARSVATVW